VTDLALFPKERRPRAPRPARVFDTEGREVFITLTCPACGRSAPLAQFGLRRMGNGQIRNCPWCKRCRAKPGDERAASFRRMEESAV